MIIVVCDLGGTHARFALAELNLNNSGPTTPKIIRNKTVLCQQYSSFEQALEDFLQDSTVSPKIAGIAAAGPIANIMHNKTNTQTIKLTNLAWQLNSNSISKAFGFDNTYLVNDFSALVFALSRGENIRLHPVQNVLNDLSTEKPSSPFLVLGPGTGLGAAIGLKHNSTISAINTEAGHSLFAPLTAQQIALLEFLRSKNIEPSWESVVSGPGLSLLYEFETTALNGDKKSGANLKAKEIIERGIESTQSIEHKVLQLFLQLLGGFCRNLALSCLPKSGIYIAGGITPRILPQLGVANFLAGFYSYPTHQNLLQQIPVNLIIDSNIGL